MNNILKRKVVQKVLITREVESAGRTASLIEALGYEVVIYPLIKIEWVPYKLAKDFVPDYIIITSLNAAKSLTDELKSIPCLIVGERSANYLDNRGFTILMVCEDVRELISKIGSEPFRAQHFKFLYLSADHVATDILGILSAQGHKVQRVIVYKSITINNFDNNILRGLSFATFYSSRIAMTFYNLCINENLSHITAVCLSKNIAKNLKELSFKNIIISKIPKEEALLRELA